MIATLVQSWRCCDWVCWLILDRWHLNRFSWRWTIFYDHRWYSSVAILISADSYIKKRTAKRTLLWHCHAKATIESDLETLLWRDRYILVRSFLGNVLGKMVVRRQVQIVLCTFLLFWFFLLPPWLSQQNESIIDLVELLALCIGSRRLWKSEAREDAKACIWWWRKRDNRKRYTCVV